MRSPIRFSGKQWGLVLTGVVGFLLASWAGASPGDSLDSVPLAHSAPRDVAVASDGSFWVVDSGAQRAVHVSADGSQVLGSFDTGGFGAAEPTGIAVVSDGTLLIVDHASPTIHNRQMDGGTAATVPEIDLGGMGIDDPLGIEVLASGDIAVVDGADGSAAIYILSSADGSFISGFLTSPLGITSAQGVTQVSDGNLWISEMDTTLLFNASIAGTLIGSVDLSPLGLSESRGLGALPDDTLWTIDGGSGNLHHHTTAGIASGSPSQFAFAEVAGLNLAGVTGITRDPYGNPWVVDSATGRVHRLSADATASLTSFDYTAWSVGINEIDIAPSGNIYLTDASTSTIHILTPDASTRLTTITASAVSATQIGSIAIDPDSSLWVVDPSALTVHHRSLDGATNLGSFALNPGAVPVPRDIEVAPSGNLWLANAQGVASTLVQLQRDGTSDPLVPSLPIGSNLGILSPQSIAVLDIGDILVTDSTRTLLITVEGPPPTISQVIHIDQATPLGVSEGDDLVLVFDQPVQLLGTLEDDDITLSEAGDTLGLAFTATDNPLNPKQIFITLGAMAQLTVPGSGAGSSALDVSATIEPGDIVDAQTGTPISSSTARDIQFNFIPSGPVTVDGSGGSVSVVASPDAVYLTHTLSIAPGALSAPIEFALDIPPDPTGLVNAVAITPGDAIFLNSNSTLTMGYTIHDLRNGDGGDEMAMRIHQLEPIGAGVFEAIPVPGIQTVDPVGDTVTVPLTSTDPLGVGIGPTLFATLPLDTLDDRTITIEEFGGGAAAATTLITGGTLDAPPPGSVLLSIGSGGLYTRHQIVIPGYVEAPEGVTLTIREATIFERYGFPITSGAIFTIEATEDLPVPVELTIEFRDFPGSGDLVLMNGTPGDRQMMRLAQRLTLNSPFEFRDDLPASVQGNSTVITGLVTPFTQTGVAVYGLAVNPEATIPVELSVFTTD